MEPTEREQLTAEAYSGTISEFIPNLIYWGIGVAVVLGLSNFIRFLGWIGLGVYALMFAMEALSVVVAVLTSIPALFGRGGNLSQEARMFGFSRIESHETAARANVASGKAVFLRAISSLECVRDLLRLAKENAAVTTQIANRIGQLVSMRTDPRYENPHDTAIAIYLWLLKQRDKDVAWVAAAVALEARNCWWAAEIARSILTRQDDRNEDSSTVIVSSPDVEASGPDRTGDGLIPLTDPSFLALLKFVWVTLPG